MKNRTRNVGCKETLLRIIFKEVKVKEETIQMGILATTKGSTVE
jgi:hypothetical protein